MLAAAFQNLVPRMKLKLASPIITNMAFKMHYRYTVAILLLGTLLVCAREMFGEHIRCFGEHDATEKFGKWINNYCFNMATFTVEKLYDEQLVTDVLPPSYHINKQFFDSNPHYAFRAIPHPGVGTYNPFTDKTLQHKFYQWVPFVLFIEAICFYMPYYIWKKKEGGRIKALVDGLQYAAVCGEQDLNVNKLNIPSKKRLDNKLNIVKKDILLRLSLNWNWSFWLISMETLNLVHVIFQIWILNRFLDGKFLGLGPSVVNFQDWSTAKITPLEPIFPKVTKCIYHKFGDSGTVENKDVMCVMALNVIHEKFFVCLWFWLMSLAVISVIAVIWRIVSYILYLRSPDFSQELFHRACSAKLDPGQVARVVAGCNYGDWMFLYYLAKNMNAVAFPRLLKLVVEELDKQELIDGLGYKKLGFEPMYEEKCSYPSLDCVDSKCDKMC